MLEVALSGITGRVGQQLVLLVQQTPGVVLTQGLMPVGHRTQANTCAPGVPVLATLLPQVQVLIDFSVPQAAVAYAQLCAASKVPFVTGTTGFSPEQQAILNQVSLSIPVFQAPNMSMGVQLLYRLVAEAAGHLPTGCDVHVVEAHRKDKRDAPSGTALALKNALIEANPALSPEMVSMRAGDLIGEHRVIFTSPYEQIELRHQAFSRQVFAVGALQAAQWLVKQPVGLYKELR